MRITTRFLAPLAILATALYLAYSATNRPKTLPMTITAKNENTAAVGAVKPAKPIKPAAAHRAGTKSAEPKGTPGALIP